MLYFLVMLDTFKYRHEEGEGLGERAGRMGAREAVVISLV